VGSTPSFSSAGKGAGGAAAIRQVRRSVAPGAVARPAVLLAGGGALLVVALFLGVGIGAVGIAPQDTVGIVRAHLGLGGAGADAQQDAILWAIRLPRVL